MEVGSRGEGGTAYQYDHVTATVHERAAPQHTRTSLRCERCLGSIDAYLCGDGALAINDADLADELRGKGIGRALYEALIDYAAGLGAVRVRGANPSEYAERVHRKVARGRGARFRTRRSKRDESVPDDVLYSYPIRPRNR